MIEDLLMLVVLGLPVAGAAYVATRLARSLKASWRILAWMPGLPLGLVCGNVFIGVVRDPTSHNLWPFEVVIAGVISLLLFGVVVFVREVFGR